MSLIRQIVSARFGSAAAARLGKARPAVRNARTLRAVVHTVEGAGGGVFEKTSLNQPPWSGGTPEALFYERVLPHWPFMQRHVCECYGVRRGLFTTTIYTAAVTPDASLSRSFDVYWRFLEDMQRTGAEVLTSGALDERTLAKLDYFRPPPRWRVAGHHSRYVRRIARRSPEAELIAGGELELLANLARLANASRAAPRAICHLDLMNHHMFTGPHGPILIDWGEARVAPAGFDYGGFLASSLRKAKRGFEGDCRGAWSALRAMAFRDEPEKDAFLLSVYYAFIVGLLRYLNAYEGDELPALQARLVREFIEPMTRPLPPEDALGVIAKI